MAGTSPAVTRTLREPLPAADARSVISHADGVAVVVVAKARAAALGLRRRRRADHRACAGADRRSGDRAARMAARHRRTDERARSGPEGSAEQRVVLLRGFA